MKTENELKREKPGGGGPGIGFLLFEMAFILMVDLGYTFVPYGRYGNVWQEIDE